ncbi:Glycosyltransferase, GT2 family [Pseudomonas sp. NFACC15-1]|uniref:glycosyltransferase n=1 Tax=unclassified Pseudomonas TaxID=196821 RepID=UPI000882DC60|nr:MULTISPECIES: glycosyltransferase [unclassified Pseudomonas]SDA52076.1 Glycosyltransferase, GT2 family [Pseudomonas sp. NFACC15-1]SDW77522.1 Glycosyltransferase, GT2 family [Pseudomonas sp. NFACC14]
MDQINRLVDCIDQLTRSTQSKSIEALQLVKEIENRDRLIKQLNLGSQALRTRLSLQEGKAGRLREQLRLAEQRLKDTEALLQTKESEAVALSDWAVDLRAQLAAKQTELFKLSDWGNAIERAPLRYSIRKRLYQLSRWVYARLPLSAHRKSKLARRLRSWLKPGKATPGESAAPAGLVPLQPLPPPVNLAVPSSDGQPMILMFGVIDWHFRIQRPQNLAKELARAGQTTFYVSNHFIDDDAPGFEAEPLEGSQRLFQIRFKVRGAPAIYHAPPSAAAIGQLCQGLAMLLQSANVGAVDCIVQHAYWFPLARRVPNATLVYDCMDHHEGFGNVAQELLDLEIALMRRADLLVATSDWIEQHGKRENRNVEVIRNACEFGFFSQRPDKVYRDPANRQIIGYYGVIAEWFDLDLVKRVAQSFPQHLILLIGSDTVQAKKYFKACSNVVLEGEVPYAALPYYLYAMDVCLLPFKVMPLTLATNPVKVYEYLSAGKPVVSVKLPELSQFGELVRAVEEPIGFISAIRDVLDALPEASTAPKARQSFARGQTWQHRAASLREAIATLPLPKVSVVVLTYNNLELTKACLDSLLTQSQYPNLEIIVVDNHSSDQTPAYLSTWADGHPDRIVILNPDNRGFAAGNNLGLAAASGDYLVILNNDTVVTAGWIKGLIRHLQDHKEIGIIGPITNNIGNEAKVGTRYERLEDMPAEAAQMTRARMGEWFEINTLAFFCVMFPRSTYEQIGGLCEEYGLGFFEDDDYCRRVQRRGMRAACAEDVFVHHHLSASFNTLGARKKQALFEKNRAIYESKWGAWVPHTYRDV